LELHIATVMPPGGAAAVRNTVTFDVPRVMVGWDHTLEMSMRPHAAGVTTVLVCTDPPFRDATKVTGAAWDTVAADTGNVAN